MVTGVPSFRFLNFTTGRNLKRLLATPQITNSKMKQHWKVELWAEHTFETLHYFSGTDDNYESVKDHYPKLIIGIQVAF